MLDEFLVSSFDSHELLRFFDQQFGPKFVAELPSGDASPRSLVFQAVRRLHRHGKIDQALIAALLEARPARSGELKRLSRSLIVPTDEDREQKTAVWKPHDPAREQQRMQWVEALEEQVLIRERSIHDAERRGAAEHMIDAYTRQLRNVPSPTPGSIVAGTRLERAVGSGNFGTVWRAHRISTGEVMATKIFNLDRLSEGVMLWRFRRSIRALKGLSAYRMAPRSIPRIAEVSTDGLAFSMSYLSEGTLEQVERRGWSLATKLAVFLEIARAVAFAHQIGIIHRDIKPANVLLDTELHPVLIDYDIADIKFVTQLSVARGGLGTPVFAAPEQLERADDADERSDIYSLGRLLHYLLLERSPGYQIERDPNLENLRGQPPGIIAVVRRATQWDPQRRYTSVIELIADVEHCQTGFAVVRARLLALKRFLRQNALLLTTVTTVTGGAIWVAAMQQQVAALRQDAIVQARESTDAMQMRFSEIQDGLLTIEGIRDDLRALDEGGRGEFTDDEIRTRVTNLRKRLDGVQTSLGSSSAAIKVEQNRLNDILNEPLLAPVPEEQVPKTKGLAAADALSQAAQYGGAGSWFKDAAAFATNTLTSVKAGSSADGGAPLEPVPPGETPSPSVVGAPVPPAAIVLDLVEGAPDKRRAVSRSYRLFEVWRVFKAEIDGPVLRCIHDDRLIGQDYLLHLNLALTTKGPVRLIDVDPPVRSETQSCIKQALRSVHVPMTEGHKYVHKVAVK